LFERMAGVFGSGYVNDRNFLRYHR
jgi:hypothetical protein